MSESKMHEYIQKAKKLARMSQDPGTSPAERESALKRLRAYLRKHNISLDSIVEVERTVGSACYRWEVDGWEALAEHFNVVVVDRDWRTGKVTLRGPPRVLNTVERALRSVRDASASYLHAMILGVVEEYSEQLVQRVKAPGELFHLGGPEQAVQHAYDAALRTVKTGRMLLDFHTQLQTRGSTSLQGRKLLGSHNYGVKWLKAFGQLQAIHEHPNHGAKPTISTTPTYFLQPPTHGGYKAVPYIPWGGLEPSWAEVVLYGNLLSFQPLSYPDLSAPYSGFGARKMHRVITNCQPSNLMSAPFGIIPPDMVDINGLLKDLGSAFPTLPIQEVRDALAWFGSMVTYLCRWYFRGLVQGKYPQPEVALRPATREEGGLDPSQEPGGGGPKPTGETAETPTTDPDEERVREAAMMALNYGATVTSAGGIDLPTITHDLRETPEDGDMTAGIRALLAEPVNTQVRALLTGP